MVWLTGAVLHHRLLSFTIVGNGWPHTVLWYHWLMPISCHFQHRKVLLFTSLLM